MTEKSKKIFYPNDIINYDDVVICYYNSSRRIANTLARDLSMDNELLQQLILHFCFLASNSPANLRIGNSKWNGVIKEDFDPTSWFYYYGEGAYISSERGYSCEPFDNNKMHEYYGDVPDLLRLGFYLSNREDGIRIRKMRELNLPVRLILKCVLELYDDENPREYPFMCSSSNRFTYRENNKEYVNLYAETSDIYFLYNNEWVSI